MGPEQISRLEFGKPPPIPWVEDNFDRLGWVSLSFSDLKRICLINPQLDEDKPSVQEKVLTKEELEKRELGAALGSALHFFRFLDTVRQQSCQPLLVANLPLTIPTHSLGACERIDSFFANSPDFWAFCPSAGEKEAAMALWERIRTLAEKEDPFIQETMRLEGYHPGLEVGSLLSKWQDPMVLEKGIDLINSSYDLEQDQYKYPELRTNVWLNKLKIRLFVILDEVIREGKGVVVRDLKTGKEGIFEVERVLLQTIAALIAQEGDSFFVPGNGAQSLDLTGNMIKSLDFGKGRVEEIRPGDPHIKDLTLPSEVCRQKAYELMEIIRRGKIYRASGHLPKAASRRKRPQGPIKRMF